MTTPTDGEPRLGEHGERIREYTASDGYVLRYRHWQPDGPPRAHVVAIHGIQSHSGWYGYSTSRLREAGYEVRYLDRRGSGLNEVDRGHALAADRLINDVAQMLRRVRWERDREGSSRPIVLMGVSWGGKLAAAIAGTRPNLVDAVALLYPGIRPLIGPSTRQRLRLGLAKRMGVRHRRVPIPLDDPALFTAEPEWQQFIANDPLAIHEASVGFLLAGNELDRIVDRTAPRLVHPLLLMLAGRDRIIDNAATKRFALTLGSNDRREILYPDAAHTLEFEPNRDRFVNDLIGWLSGVGVPTEATGK